MDQDKKKPHHHQCTIDDRLVIQHRLNEGISFNAIAKEIGKHRTTVSLEVRRNSVAVQKGAFGRPFNDCAHRHLPIAQTDTVIGRVGGKVLLTILLLDCDLLIPILLEHKTAACVTAAYQDLAQRLRAHGIEPPRLLAITLTDRGTEFSAPTAIEGLGTPENPIRVFYCDPNSPFQKGAIERAHTDLRRILTSGSSFDHLTQHDIDRIASHHNSYIRPILGNRTPIAVARERYGQALLDALNITEIPPCDVILTPALLAPRQP